MEKKPNETQEVAKIDNEVLTIIEKKNIISTLDSEKLTRRAILNCACELDSQLRLLNSNFSKLVNVFTIASAEKLRNFFGETKKGIAKVQVKNKIALSHQKKS